MNERWEKWEPVSGLQNKYYIDSIVDNVDGFKIIFSEVNDPKKIVHITFDGGVSCHRDTDESYIDNLLLDLGNKYGNEFYWNWTFFKVSDSEYMRWLSKRSSGISDSAPLIHFSFLAVNTNLDVLATYEPIVEVQNQ